MTTPVPFPYNRTPEPPPDTSPPPPRPVTLIRYVCPCGASYVLRDGEAVCPVCEGKP